MTKIIPVLLLLILTSCSDKLSFKTTNDNYKLFLYPDSTYSFCYSTYIGDDKETGAYKFSHDSIILKRLTENTYDTLSWWTNFSNEIPDTVSFNFKNLNDSSICVALNISNNPTILKTNKSGQLKLPYKDLVTNNFITKDSSFYKLKITFDNKVYKTIDTFVKPTNIDIKLNQYIGKRTATMYRKYLFQKDAIIVKDINCKTEFDSIVLKKY